MPPKTFKVVKLSNLLAMAMPGRSSSRSVSCTLYQISTLCFLLKGDFLYNTTDVAIGAGTATLPEHLSSPPVFSGVRVARFLILCVMYCRSLFVLCLLPIVLSVLLSFAHCVVCSSVFCPLCCLFFDLRFLITPQVSSNCSYHSVWQSVSED